MALALTTLTDSIASLSVSGLTIYDIDQIPEAAERDVPCMYPEGIDFITNMTTELAAFGLGTASKWNVEYDLHYTLLYTPIGSGRGVEKFAGMMTLAFQVIDAILDIATISGAVRLTFAGISVGPVVSDPAGNQYWGARLTFHALEFVD